MGRNTFASLGFRKLPGRTSVVVTSDPELGDKYGVETYTSLADAIAAHRGEPEIMIIGGGRLYREAVNYGEDFKADEQNDFDYSFCVYERK